MTKAFILTVITHVRDNLDIKSKVVVEASSQEKAEGKRFSISAEMLWV